MVNNERSLKMEKAIKVGALVKSFDFPGRKDCYIVGSVVGFKNIEGCPRYEIICSGEVWEGKELEGEAASRVGMKFYPPLNGVPKSMGGSCNGVEEICPPGGSSVPGSPFYRGSDFS